MKKMWNIITFIFGMIIFIKLLINIFNKKKLITEDPYFIYISEEDRKNFEKMLEEQFILDKMEEQFNNKGKYTL